MDEVVVDPSHVHFTSSDLVLEEAQVLGCGLQGLGGVAEVPPQQLLSLVVRELQHDIGLHTPYAQPQRYTASAFYLRFGIDTIRELVIHTQR